MSGATPSSGLPFGGSRHTSSVPSSEISREASDSCLAEIYDCDKSHDLASADASKQGEAQDCCGPGRGIAEYVRDRSEFGRVLRHRHALQDAGLYSVPEAPGSRVAILMPFV